MEKTVRAAVVQASSVVFDPDKSIDKLRELTREAAAKGAQLVVFPEAFISAYPKGLDFGARVGSRQPEGRLDFRRYFESAIDVPGPHVERIGATAKEAGVHLVAGVIERDIGTLYCTILFFAPDGRYLGKHRKLMPTAMERLIWGFGDGSTLPVFDTELGKLGAVICWENFMPLLRTAMYSKGIQLYCAPTADSRDTCYPPCRWWPWKGAVLCSPPVSTCSARTARTITPPPRVTPRTPSLCAAAAPLSLLWDKCWRGRTSRARASWSQIWRWVRSPGENMILMWWATMPGPMCFSCT